VQCRERLTLGRITLAEHFAKLGARPFAGQASEPAAGLDASQLAAVADGDDLDARLLGVSEDLRADSRASHPGLVDQQHRV
jgi:hypothetical protein